MEHYFRTISITLVGTFVCLILSKNAKDYGLLIGIILCCMIGTLAAWYFKPILELIDKFGQISDHISPWIVILVKSVGLSFIGETVSAICIDAGQAAIAKVMQTTTTLAILWVSIPLIQSLMDLIYNILEML